MDVVTLKKKVFINNKTRARDSKNISKIRGKFLSSPPAGRAGSQNDIWNFKIKSKSIERGLKVRQKNIQLRPDQIKKLREYTFRSGSIDGVQLNDSEICRVALDLFFWLEIDPKSVNSEEDMLDICKKKIKNNMEGGIK